MKTEVLNAIKDITEVKTNQKKYPSYALKMEILRVLRQRVEEELINLEKEGQITKIETFNDMAYNPV